MRSTTRSRLQMVAEVQQGSFMLQVRRESGAREPVSAALVPVAPHITVDTFAVHRGIGGYDDAWVVSSRRSGCFVAVNFLSKEAAIEAARTKLAGCTDADLLSRFDAVGA